MAPSTTPNQHHTPSTTHNQHHKPNTTYLVLVYTPSTTPKALESTHKWQDTESTLTDCWSEIPLSHKQFHLILEEFYNSFHYELPDPSLVLTKHRSQPVMCLYCLWELAISWSELVLFLMPRTQKLPPGVNYRATYVYRHLVAPPDGSPGQILLAFAVFIGVVFFRCRRNVRYFR